jgi:hypothetical protein
MLDSQRQPKVGVFISLSGLCISGFMVGYLYFSRSVGASSTVIGMFHQRIETHIPKGLTRDGVYVEPN